jgi:F420-non-reducing hydrogenase iron-sulfur subunit
MSGQATKEMSELTTDESFEPRITAFVCNWCTYTGADLAGTSRLHMASNVRIIRLPCTGRIDPMFVVKAFERGADGVIVSGCHPADCHYTSGNYHARRRFTVFHELASFLGIDPGRITFSWVSASEGAKWRDIVDEAVARVRTLGPFSAYRELVGRPNMSGESYATLAGLFGGDAGAAASARGTAAAGPESPVLAATAVEDAHAVVTPDAAAAEDAAHAASAAYPAADGNES